MTRRLSLLLAIFSVFIVGCGGGGPKVPETYTVMVQNATGSEIGDFTLHWGPENSEASNVLKGEKVIAGEGRFTAPAWAYKKIAIPETFTVDWTLTGQTTIYTATFTIPPESINERVTNFTIDLKPGHASCKIVVKAKSGPGSTFSDPIPVKMSTTKPPTASPTTDTAEPATDLPAAPATDTATPE